MDSNLIFLDKSAAAPPSPLFNMADYYAQQEQSHFLRDCHETLLKRKWWVVGVFLAVVCLVGSITLMMTPIYRSSVTLQIIQDNPSALVGERDPFSMLPGQETLTRFYETQYTIMKSRPMIFKIIDSLNLKDHPEYLKLQERFPRESGEELENKFAEYLLKNLDVRPVKKSYLVEIFFISPDQQLAQKVPNAIHHEYVKFSMNTRHTSYKLIKEWLERELQSLAEKVVASERKLYEHGQKKEFLSMEGAENVITKKYVDLSMLLTKAESDKTAKEAQYRQVKDRGVDAPLIINNLLIQKLREETISQEARVASISQIYDENYPKLQAEQAKLRDLRLRLNNEVQRIKASIESDYEAALRTENLLGESLLAQKDKVVDLQNNLVQHHILKRDMQANEQLYQALLARMKEASVASTMVNSNVAVIAAAEFPLKPYRPNKLLNFALAAMVGLFGGVSLAFLVEYLDDSLKSAKEVERVCRVPLYGVVPYVSQNHKSMLPQPEPQELQLAPYRQPKSLISEAIHNIHTSLMLSLSGGPPVAIMITSPNPNEGKSTLSVNLATSIAIHDRKVVLVDCDLRKPSLQTLLSAPPGPGLSNYLSGSASAKDILQPTHVPNLCFIPAGSIPPNPVQLLASQAFRDLAQDLRQEFQHVIFDTSPILGFADTRVITPVVDGVLLLFKHYATSREAARLAIQLLTQVNAQILGCILNMATVEHGGYYNYYKYYKHYYHQDGQATS